jgi:hypothetical protein
MGLTQPAVHYEHFTEELSDEERQKAEEAAIRQQTGRSLEEAKRSVLDEYTELTLKLKQLKPTVKKPYSELVVKSNEMMSVEPSTGARPLLRTEQKPAGSLLPGNIIHRNDAVYRVVDIDKALLKEEEISTSTVKPVTKSPVRNIWRGFKPENASQTETPGSTVRLSPSQDLTIKQLRAQIAALEAKKTEKNLKGELIVSPVELNVINKRLEFLGKKLNKLVNPEKPKKKKEPKPAKPAKPAKSPKPAKPAAKKSKKKAFNDMLNVFLKLS